MARYLLTEVPESHNDVFSQLLTSIIFFGSMGRLYF